MYSRFEALLQRPQQRFVCTDTGWPEPGPVRHVAHVVHDVTPALDASALARLQEVVGDLPEVLAFYRRWGSARLFRDTVEGQFDRASAYLIAHPADWPELYDGLDGWIDALSDDERIELLPEWIDHIAVIGEVPQSGNYFLLVLDGPERGRVFEFEHDGFEFIERGRFAAFVERLATVDDALLADIRAHTRYADGATSTQWLCREYLHGADAALAACP